MKAKFVRSLNGLKRRKQYGIKPKQSKTKARRYGNFALNHSSYFSKIRHATARKPDLDRFAL